MRAITEVVSAVRTGTPLAHAVTHHADPSTHPTAPPPTPRSSDVPPTTAPPRRPQRPTPTSGPKKSWALLAVALAAQILVVLDISVVNTALPSIGRALRPRGQPAQWLVTAYLMMSGGGLLLGGRIADLLSRRRVFLTGLTLFTVASLVSGFADSGSQLIAARAVQGLSAALLTPSALSLIMTTYAGAQRKTALAMWGAVGSLGVAAGVLLGGALTTWASWQSIFWINGPDRPRRPARRAPHHRQETVTRPSLATSTSPAPSPSSPGSPPSSTAWAAPPPTAGGPCRPWQPWPSRPSCWWPSSRSSGARPSRCSRRTSGSSRPSSPAPPSCSASPASSSAPSS